jgi:peptidoglycan-associated lipoprotein
VLEERIHFDYDASDIRADARRILDSKLPLIRADPTLRLRIEGHADERGSTEYNLALGTRRAASVASYFSGFGIDGSRFPIASYGEERPLLPGSDEAAWSQNRRAEFVIIAGAVLGASGPDR